MTTLSQRYLRLVACLAALVMAGEAVAEAMFAGPRSAVGDSPVSVAVADLDGDTVPDLVTANSSSDDLSVLLGRGDGTFTYPPINHFVDEYPQGLVTGDFNKDGKMDLAVSCRDKNLLTVLLKKNTRPFGPSARPIAPS